MNAWAILGIEPTRDATLIRRAYALRLKGTRPDDDPEGFQRLRAAREAALHQAEQPDPKPALEPSDETASAGMTAPAEWVDAVDPVPAAPAADPEAGQPSRAQVQTGVVDAVAPLVAQRRHWDTAERLVPQVVEVLARVHASRGVFDVEGFEALLREAGALPYGPRRTVEEACLARLTAWLRTPDGAFSPSQARRVKPLMVAADLAFGWSRDDAVITEKLAPRDADAVLLMLSETAHEISRSPFAAADRRKPSRLLPADAKAYFALWPTYAALQKQMAASGRVSPKVRWLGLCLPYVWAFRHRLWVTGLGLYAVSAMAALLVLAADGANPYAALCMIGGGVLYVAVFAVTGFYADKILAGAALRAVRQANHRGLFDAQSREAFLRKKHASFSFGILFLTAHLVFAPMLGVVVLIGRLVNPR